VPVNSYKPAPVGYSRHYVWIIPEKCLHHKCRDCRNCSRIVRVSKFVRRPPDTSADNAKQFSAQTPVSAPAVVQAEVVRPNPTPVVGEIYSAAEKRTTLKDLIQQKKQSAA
jgi:hypothetical protein